MADEKNEKKKQQNKNFCGGITRLNKRLGELQGYFGWNFTFRERAPIPYVQATIFKLLYPLIRSATALHDILFLSGILLRTLFL